MNLNKSVPKPMSRNAACVVLAMPFVLVAMFIGICAMNRDFSMLAHMLATIGIASPACVRAINRLKEHN